MQQTATGSPTFDLTLVRRPKNACPSAARSTAEPEHRCCRHEITVWQAFEVAGISARRLTVICAKREFKRGANSNQALRRTAGTLVCLHTGGLRAVRDFLGHANTRMTANYAHVVDNGQGESGAIHPGKRGKRRVSTQLRPRGSQQKESGCLADQDPQADAYNDACRPGVASATPIHG